MASATSLTCYSIALAAVLLLVTNSMPYAESFGVVPNRQISCLACVKDFIKRDGCDQLVANGTTVECSHCGQTAMAACAQDACRKACGNRGMCTPPKPARSVHRHMQQGHLRVKCSCHAGYTGAHCEFQASLPTSAPTAGTSPSTASPTESKSPSPSALHTRKPRCNKPAALQHRCTCAGGCRSCARCLRLKPVLQKGYHTMFRTVDKSWWQQADSCHQCSLSRHGTPSTECTRYRPRNLRAGSIGGGAGLTIVVSKLSPAAGAKLTKCASLNRGNAQHAAAQPGTSVGGTSGFLSSQRMLHFGKISVKARFFSEPSGASSAKGFIGLEDAKSGAITITVHGKGGSASGGGGGAVGNGHTIQSSCYHHGNNHNKAFSNVAVAPGTDLSQTFHWFEIDWSPSTVAISVDGKVVRTVSGAGSVPQQPLSMHLSARSVDYPSMSVANMTMEIEEFRFEPAAAAADYHAGSHAPPIGKKIPQLFMNPNLKPTISGLSAGGAWSVQFAVAFSRSVGGAAIFSGKTYHCLKGDCISNCSHVRNEHCHDPESAWGNGCSVRSLVNLTRYAARQGYIDDTSNMARNRYYFFRGRSDSVYKEGAMNATLKYFSAFAQPENIRNEIDEIDAAHTIPTLKYGNPCTQQGRPFINNCNFDGAGQALQFLYKNSLRNRNDRDLPYPASFIQFDQTALGSNNDGMANFGMAYIPAACLAASNTSGNGCRLHLHFHGTNMNIQGCHRLHGPWDCGQDAFGRYVSTPDSAHSGFNNWAEANNIVVVYPQVSGRKWDNAGGSGDGYAWKSSAQMTSVKRIMQAFHGKPPGLS